MNISKVIYSGILGHFKQWHNDTLCITICSANFRSQLKTSILVYLVHVHVCLVPWETRDFPDIAEGFINPFYAQGSVLIKLKSHTVKGLHFDISNI